MPASILVAELRRYLAGLSSGGSDSLERVDFGVPNLDAHLQGGIVRAALHEVYAPGMADLAAATGFTLGLASRAARQRPILWVRQDAIHYEAGHLFPPGLSELGLAPERFFLVKARDAAAVLRAGVEGARCSALGAVLIEPCGDPPLLDLTASRRLALAAEASGTLTLLLRAARPSSSAAQTRWLAASLPSRPLEANAPGPPSFAVRLLRHRSGIGESAWHVEWDRDQHSFRPAYPDVRADGGEVTAPPPLPRPVATVSADRPDEAEQAPARRHRTG